MTQVARQPYMMVAKLGPMPDFREFHSGTKTLFRNWITTLH